MRRALVIAGGVLVGLASIRAALADHDDGDDVKEYEYVLRFDADELSRFAGYIVVDSSDMEPTFTVTRRIGGDQQGSKKPGDVPLVYAGSIPVTIYALPGRDLLARVESWTRAEAARSPDGILSPEPEVVRKFDEKFGREAHRLSYARSPLLTKMLGLAKCKVHFLEGPQDRLKAVYEYLSLRYASPRQARIATTRYHLLYDDGVSLELSEERAARLTEAECRGLFDRKGKGVAGSTLTPEGLWHAGAPALAAALLAGIALQRRRA